MKMDMPLDYAVFQLSPKRSRCELFASYNGTTEKIASGLVKPFVTHLKVAEEQVGLAVKSIKLEVERCKNAETWFTKGTLERFVRFVSTPEVLEMVNTFDTEMSQLEAARRIYSEGAAYQHSSAPGGDRKGATAASDATKKELLRAIDVRLAAVKQDLITACTCAFAAGFYPETLSELQQFADCFGAHRLSEACGKFIALSHRRPDLFNNLTCKSSSDLSLRSSSGSDMSLDDPLDDEPKPAIGQQPTTTTTTKLTYPLRRFSREPSPGPGNELVDRENHQKDNALAPTNPTTGESDSSVSSTQSSQTPQLMRRLSVQERISMFENKQKQNSPSTNSSGAGKPELRRLSSDVASSTDKVVLRRWSGASDMSIDVSGERKEPNSNANTPTSSSSHLPVFPPKPTEQGDMNGEEGDKYKDSKMPVRANFGFQSSVSSGAGSRSEESALPDLKVASLSGRSLENVGLKGQQNSGGGVQSRETSFCRGKEFLENQSTPKGTQIRFEPASQDMLEGPSRGGNRPREDIGKKFGVSATQFGDGRSDGQQREAEDDGQRDHQIPSSHFRASQRGTVEEVASGSAASEFDPHSLVQIKRGEADLVPAQPKWRSLEGEVERVKKKGSELFDEQAESFSLEMESSGLLRGNFQGHGSGSNHVKKPGGRIEHSGSRVRQLKGSQGFDAELQMKANELEKLLEEHKLRVPGDQSNSARRTRPVEMLKEQEGSYTNRKQATESSPAQMTTMKMEAEPATGCSNMEKFNSTPSIRTVDSTDYDVTPQHNIYSLSFSDDSRGKLFQKYMQKRDTKLREDWSSRRVEKEAKMKVMQDNLEKSRAEMSVKLAGSAVKRNSFHDARQRAEKLRSFNVRSAMKREQRIDSFVNDEDEDGTEFIRKNLSKTFLGDSSSRSIPSKRVLPNKSTASSSPRNSTAPIPRSSGKASNCAAGRRKLHSDNPLAQSVPNFSDLREENTKPTSAGSKPARPQVRNHARTKSSSEDLLPVDEEKQRSQFSRKSTANPVELNDSRNSNDVYHLGFTPSKYDIEETDEFDECSEDTESRVFPRNGNSVGHVTSSGIGRSKASLMTTAVTSGNDFEDLTFRVEEMMDMNKEEEEDRGATVGDESAEMENGEDRLSQESNKSATSGYESANAFGHGRRYLSQAGSGSVTELPTSVPSILGAMRSMQDSPGESPKSWNSPLHNPFSFSCEISNIDPSESPIGSPASWNFHTLAQTEADASRLRKKWGASQKPIVGIDSSHGISRKDVPKGLKRFLKFGRKNCAAESLADWISATTSEGDDDTEDGRDPANRSSEDLRKSRMGFSHYSDEGLNESNMFNEQVQAPQSSIPTPPTNFKLREEQLSGSSLKGPKSFFSLSNFRSKGSDSKPR